MRLPLVLIAACFASSAVAQTVPRLKPVAAPSVSTQGAGRAAGIVVQGGRDCDDAAGRPGTEAIGPKQDDPRARGIIVQGGLQGDGATGGGAPGVLAIGPKQDDPSRPGTAARPGDDNDPKASGVRSARDAASGMASGRRMLAIGPKQDDPRSPAGAVARPGDDEDPKARCVPRGP